MKIKIFIHRGVNVEEKRLLIYNCAKELFSDYGFKDTNISAIMKKAGMAIGTFYNYYPSKEKLFMDIFMEENVKLKKKCMQSLDLNQEPLEVIQKMLVLNLEGTKSHPILKEWYNKYVFDKIEKLFREENGLQAVDFLYDNFLDIIENWQSEGKMRSDIDKKMIMTIFAAIINVETHKDEIGINYFPQVINYITEFVIKGLTDCPNQK